MNNNPWWWPRKTNEEWIAEMRADYPEATETMSDEDIRYKYAEGAKYQYLWDYLGDAKEDYDKLADEFLKLVAETGKKPSDFTA